MITVLRNGRYKLVETESNTKILYLDSNVFAWVEPVNIGELLVYSHKPHRTDCVLSLGEYRLYEVRDEPYLSEQIHLELEVGSWTWQGYLLLSGLPNKSERRVRIIPTIETVTGNPHYHRNKVLTT
jgi:hypothetical protein